MWGDGKNVRGRARCQGAHGDAGRPVRRERRVQHRRVQRPREQQGKNVINPPSPVGGEREQTGKQKIPCVFLAGAQMYGNCMKRQRLYVSGRGRTSDPQKHSVRAGQVKVQAGGALRVPRSCESARGTRVCVSQRPSKPVRSRDTPPTPETRTLTVTPVNNTLSGEGQTPTRPSSFEHGVCAPGKDREQWTHDGFRSVGISRGGSGLTVVRSVGLVCMSVLLTGRPERVLR